MAAHVCPWWSVWFTINNPLRRLVHDPPRIVGPYVKPGMAVMDVGCGAGWFSIPMARMVGDQGRVIAVDLQPQMLDMVRRRAEKAGVAARITAHLCQPDRFGLDAHADFALAFAMVHEVPDPNRLFAEIYGCLNNGGKLLVAEPPLHVPSGMFANEIAAAKQVGFRVVAQPRVRWSRAAVFEKVTGPL